ncbi:MAG TPA: RNA methyltransferase [Streptosporangiaceae bacterium]|nr:RNA methyltransferase [Streptosporangiaceae bacterium]
MPEPYRATLISAGLKHPRVREFLAAKRHPVSHGLAYPVALESSWMVGQAMLAGVTLRAVFVCPALLEEAAGLALAEKAVGLGAEGYEVSEKVISRLTGRDRPDGIAASGLALQRTLGDIRVGRRTRVVIADGWDLPGNLGTLIRCADAAGASGVLVVGQNFGLSHPLVLKASLAAALTVPVVAVGRQAAIQWLRDEGFRIVAADPAGSRSYRNIDYRGPLAIVVGSERRGLASEWLAGADSIAAIPMLGTCDSLNAALAGALLLYEALAQGGDEC